MELAEIITQLQLVNERHVKETADLVAAQTELATLRARVAELASLAGTFTTMTPVTTQSASPAFAAKLVEVNASLTKLDKLVPAVVAERGRNMEDVNRENRGIADAATNSGVSLTPPSETPAEARARTASEAAARAEGARTATSAPPAPVRRR